MTLKINSRSSGGRLGSWSDDEEDDGGLSFSFVVNECDPIFRGSRLVLFMFSSFDGPELTEATSSNARRRSSSWRIRARTSLSFSLVASYSGWFAKVEPSGARTLLLRWL